MEFLTGVHHRTIQGVLRRCNDAGSTTAEHFKRGGRKRKFGAFAARVGRKEPECVVIAAEPECPDDMPIHELDQGAADEGVCDAPGAFVGLNHAPLRDYLAGCLDETAHPHLKPGLLLASLAANLNAEGLPLSSFTRFVDFVDHHAPGSCGSTNHRDFARNYVGAMSRELERRQCQMLWGVVPALGIPSDFQRVLDHLTPNHGETLLIVTLVITTATGDIVPVTLDLRHIAANKHDHATVRFKSVRESALAVRRVEAKFKLDASACLHRHCVTVGDGALVGNGVRLDRALAQSAGQVGDGWPELGATCELHVAENVGKHVDSRAPLALRCEAVLRRVKRRFGGPGIVSTLMRSLALHFKSKVVEATSTAQRLTESMEHIGDRNVDRLEAERSAALTLAEKLVTSGCTEWRPRWQLRKGRRE